MTTQTRNLYQRLAAIGAALPTMEKDSRVSTGKGSFKAVSHDNVVRTCKPLMIEHGVWMTATVADHTHETFEVERSGRDGKYTSLQHWHEVRVELAFVNVDNPEERLEIQSYGTAIDSGDKGYGKAVSYAKKYALLLAFLGETGEDTDSGTHTAGGPRGRQGGRPPAQGRGAPPRGRQAPPPGPPAGPPEGPPPGHPAAGPPQGQAPPEDPAKHPLEPSHPMRSNGLPIAANFDPRLWESLKREWHDRGVISDGKRKRLFAVAINEGGWQTGDVAAVVEHYLGVPVERLPWGRLYDELVAAFAITPPADQGMPAPTAGPARDDDIPF